MSDQSIEEKKDDITETGEDLEEESESQKKLQEMRGKLEELMKQMSNMDSQIEALTEEAKDEALSEVGRKKKELAAAELREQKKPIEAEADDLRKEIAVLEFEQEHNRNFNKFILLKNIRELLKHSKVKLGQIEKEAGCQPGYMSRLEKEGNTTDPSVEFVVTAAMLFDISIDALINSEIKDVTPTEEYVLTFLKSLTEDTREDQITWARETIDTIESTFHYTEDPDDLQHPLFNWVDDDYDGDGRTIHRYEYMTAFYRGTDAMITGNSYHATLPGSNSDIYLMSCRRTVGDEFDAEIKNYFEMYLVKGPDVIPLCCSSATSEPVAMSINELYKEIERSSAHVHINKNARDAIDKYFQVKNAPF